MIFKEWNKASIEKSEHKKMVRKLRIVRFLKFALFAEIAIVESLQR